MKEAKKQITIKPFGKPASYQVLQEEIKKNGSDVNSGLQSTRYKKKVEVEAHGTVNALLKRIKSQ